METTFKDCYFPIIRKQLFSYFQYDFVFKECKIVSKRAQKFAHFTLVYINTERKTEKAVQKVIVFDWLLIKNWLRELQPCYASRYKHVVGYNAFRCTRLSYYVQNIYAIEVKRVLQMCGDIFFTEVYTIISNYLQLFSKSLSNRHTYCCCHWCKGVVANTNHSWHMI